MGPHPEVPVNVQKYIGSYLITQQPRPKRKICPRHGDKNAAYCTCRVQGGLEYPGYQNVATKNCAWTGLPLISIASSRHKSRPPGKPKNSGPSSIEEILPISRLAIHAQGAPLIIPPSDNDIKSFAESGSGSWGSGSSSPSVITSSPSSYGLDDGEVSSRQLSPLPSDSVSTTSEDSGTSENGLPRIIKPRKRRKKDRRMTVESSSGKPASIEEVIGSIVTLKPYQPLCYGYADSAALPSQPKEFYCDSSRSHYPYRSSTICCCPYCIPSATVNLVTPPDSPVDSQDSSSSWKSLSPKVTSPRDMEIKFLPCSSDEDSTHFLNDHHFMDKSTSSKLPNRPWIRLAQSDPSVSSCKFTVMCYNILCDKYATCQMYSQCPNWALEWSYRKKNIMNEIRQYKADIISLQEVETEQFYQYFLPELSKDGYDGIFSPKSRAKTMSESDRKHVDGCAIFFKTHKFFLIKEHLVEFNQLAMANAEGSDDMLNRVMTKDNIGLAALLQTRTGAYEGNTDPMLLNQTLLVCTVHIHWDPEYSDVKLIQTMMLMHELQSIVMETLESSSNPNVQKDDPNCIPMVLCGDLNSLPGSGVIEYLSSGRVSTKHCDFKQFFYEDCLRKLGTSLKSNEFTHPFKISRAYNDDIMPFTNYSYDFKGIIDYVFYSSLHMMVLGVLGPIDNKWLRENKIHGCPHPQVPSDHFPIVVELQLASSQPIHPPPPNGIITHR